MEGTGTQLWRCGRCYEGQWRQDMMWGEGRLLWPTGESYEGQFRREAFHGKGTRVWPNGDMYTGEFDSGEQEGSGTFKSEVEGWVFQGQWIHGRMYGKGRVKWPDGTVYEGEWRDGVRDGDGQLTWPDGSIFEGCFQRNHIEGRGRKTFADGAWFEGQFSDGEFEGHGTFHWPDGTEFEGLWHQSEISGPGCHRFPGGTTITGTFEDSGASGEGTKRWACGCVYTGMLLKNRIDRCGTFKWPGGRCYIGRFEDDAMHGEGTLVWADSGGVCTYRGEFQRNAFEGRGTLEWSSGARFEGEFFRGLYHGEGCFEWPGRHSLYKGHWVLGEMSGKGRLECGASDSGGDIGYVYVGAFHRGQLEGKGQVNFKLPSGNYDEYRGEFHFSRFYGRGTFTWSSGASLEGLFEDGFCNRVGRKVYPDGHVYTGSLRHDLEHGRGVVSELGGRNLVAIWQDGKPVKELMQSYAPELQLAAGIVSDAGTSSGGSSRHELSGGFDDGKVVGEADVDAKSVAARTTAGSKAVELVNKLSGGSLLPIMDKNGELVEGKAIVGFLNGDRYVGCMRGGRKHGRGMYVYADHVTYTGIWQDDMLGGVRHPVTLDVLPIEVKKLHSYEDISEFDSGSNDPWGGTLPTRGQSAERKPRSRGTSAHCRSMTCQTPRSLIPDDWSLPPLTCAASNANSLPLHFCGSSGGGGGSGSSPSS